MKAVLPDPGDYPQGLSARSLLSSRPRAQSIRKKSKVTKKAPPFTDVFVNDPTLKELMERVFHGSYESCNICSYTVNCSNISYGRQTLLNICQRDVLKKNKHQFALMF